jgi:hypothetical protein
MMYLVVSFVSEAVLQYGLLVAWIKRCSVFFYTGPSVEWRSQAMALVAGVDFRGD